MNFDATSFTAVESPATLQRGKPCRPIFKGALTHDLRLA
jgi:hypothetical protein